MEIRDLIFLEECSTQKSLLGGVYAEVQVSASTSCSWAGASASSVTLGQSTSAFVDTRATVRNTSFSTHSRATATGVASAQTGYRSTQIKSTERSFSGYISYTRR